MSNDSTAMFILVKHASGHSFQGTVLRLNIALVAMAASAHFAGRTLDLVNCALTKA